MAKGIVLFYHHMGWGFIRPISEQAEGYDDIFYHRSAIQDSQKYLTEGEIVQFDRTMRPDKTGKLKPMAIDIRRMETETAKATPVVSGGSRESGN